MDFPIEEHTQSSTATPSSAGTTATAGSAGTGSTTTSSGRPSVPPPFPPNYDFGADLTTEGDGISSHFEDDLMREFDQKHSNLSSFLDDRVSDLTSVSQVQGHKSESDVLAKSAESEKPKDKEHVVPSSDPFDTGFPSSKTYSETEKGGRPSNESQYPEASDIYQLHDPDNEYEIVRRGQHEVEQHGAAPLKKIVGDVGEKIGKTGGELLFDLDDKEIGKTDLGGFGYGLGGAAGIGPGAGTGAGDQGHGQGSGIILDEHEQLMGQFERVSPNMMNFAYEDTTVAQSHEHSHEVPQHTQSATSTFSSVPPFGQQSQIPQHFGSDDEDDFEKDSISQQSQSQALSSKLSDSLEAFQDIPRENPSVNTNANANFPPPVLDHFAPPNTLGLESEDQFEKDSISYPLSSQRLSDSLEVLKDSPQKDLPMDESLMDLEDLPSSKNSLKSISPNEPDLASPLQPHGNAGLGDDFAMQDSEILPPPPLLGIGTAADGGSQHIENSPSSPFDLLSTESDSQSGHSQSQSSAIFGGYGMDELPEIPPHSSNVSTPFGLPDISNVSEIASSTGALSDVSTTAVTSETPALNDVSSITPEEEEIPPPIPPHQNLGSPPKVTSTPFDNEITDDIITNERPYDFQSVEQEKQPEIQDVLNPFKASDLTSSTYEEQESSEFMDTFTKTRMEHTAAAPRDLSPSPPPIPPHRQQQPEMDIDEGKDIFRETDTESKEHQSITEDLEDLLPKETEKFEPLAAVQEVDSQSQSQNESSGAGGLEQFEFSMAEAEAPEFEIAADTEKENIIKEAKSLVSEILESAGESKDIDNDHDSDFEAPEGQPKYELKVDEPAFEPEVETEATVEEGQSESVPAASSTTSYHYQEPIEVSEDVQKILNIFNPNRSFKSIKSASTTDTYHLAKLTVQSGTSEEEELKIEDSLEDTVMTSGADSTELKNGSNGSSPYADLLGSGEVPPSDILPSNGNSKSSSCAGPCLTSVLCPRAWFQPEKLHPTVCELVYWRDPKKSGIVFGALLVILLALTSLSLISVVAYSSLAVLSGTLAFRVYKSVLQAVQKTQDGHPFKEYLELELAVSNEKGQELSTAVINYLNATAAKLRSLFLVEDIVESAKFGVVLYLLTYIGAWFNGLTLVILGLIALFAAPKVYETNKTVIDQYLDLVQAKISEISAKVTAAVPFLAKKDKAQ